MGLKFGFGLAAETADEEVLQLDVLAPHFHHAVHGWTDLESDLYAQRCPSMEPAGFTRTV